jgi:hypothetical protein
MGEASESDIVALERFVAENDELLELEEKIGRFNVFDALGVARTEIKHSNFLAWLFDPNESHGQGDLFLKAVLMDVTRHARRLGRTLSISAVDVECGELRDIEVRRETNQIDLAVVSHSHQFAMIIENKIDSGEHSDQLSRYRTLINESELKRYERLFVFLSPGGINPSDDAWMTYTYRDLHRVITKVRERGAGTLGTDVGVFLSHYLNLIESRLMDDVRIQELCRKIAATHRRALRLIWDTVGSPSAGVISTICDVLKENEADIVITGSGSTSANFCPKMWIGQLCTDKGETLPSGVASMFCEVHAKPESLHLRVIVGPSNDAERRKRVISMLVREKNPFGFKMQRKDPTDTWSRVFSRTIATWNQAEEPDHSKIADKFRAAIHELLPNLLDVPEAVLAVK